MECPTVYRSKPVESSDNDSDEGDNDVGSDDQGESEVWKRRTIKKPQLLTQEQRNETVKSPPQTDTCLPELGASRKRKANTVWSNVLQEQILGDDLGHIGFTNTSKLIRFQDRTCENYDYRRRYLDNRAEIIPEGGLDMDTDLGIDETGLDSVPSKFRKFDDGFRHNDRYVKLTGKDLAACRKIIYVLSEPKKHLIYRVVYFLGAEMALKLLKMTEDIEEQGGLQTKNNARRRSPGGVYIQLLKSDKNVTKEQLDDIFAFEPSIEDIIKQREERKKENKLLKGKRKQKGKKKASMESEMPADSPDKSSDSACIEDTKETVLNDPSETSGSILATDMKVNPQPCNEVAPEDFVIKSKDVLASHTHEDSSSVNNTCIDDDDEIEDGEITD